MARPFELNDIVTMTEIGNNHIGFVWLVTTNSVIIMLDNSTGRKARFDLNGNHLDEDYQHYPQIKHIRHPRKGGKEARDICAMLGRYQHKNLIGMLKVWVEFCGDKDRDIAIKNYWETRKRGGFNEQSETYLHFQRAKSMLK